ncbi:MAG TPA: hypothetical protein VGO11_21135, partial [Chthoniobacteraceae bacterium]|nr:hypothetical protein [Chthoniobacteraceae bacterium]
MTGRFLLLSISALLGSLAWGEPLPDVSTSTDTPAEPPTEIQAPAEVETPPELADTIREQDAASKTLEQKDAEARTALREWYASSLETMRQDAISQGDLDKVIALDLERQRVDTEITPEEKAKLFYTLRELRGRYERERTEQMRHATAEVRAGLLRYAVALDRLAGIFLQHGNPAAARVVERARLSMLGVPPTTACAVVYTSPGSSARPASTGSSTAATGNHGASSAKAGAVKPAVVVTGSTTAKSSASVASAPAANSTGGSTLKGKSPSAPEKTVAVKSAPTATKVSAPAVPKVAAKETAPKKAAPQSSGKSGPAPARAVATSRPAAPSAPAPRSAPA